MDHEEYDDLLRRLTALVIKLDESHDELKEFNRQQVLINQRLETLMERAWRSSSNGHTD
jgi:hypothetical protein